jgi:hypothetical protein
MYRVRGLMAAMLIALTGVSVLLPLLLEYISTVFHAILFSFGVSFTLYFILAVLLCRLEE